MPLEESKQLVFEKNLRHVAFIMDGNGRWAKKKGMPREYGHTVGSKTFRRVITYCYKCGIECVTVYAFSTENWKRSEKEVSALMRLFSAPICLSTYFSTKQIVLQGYTPNKKERHQDALLF